MVGWDRVGGGLGEVVQLTEYTNFVVIACLSCFLSFFVFFFPSGLFVVL